jgi:hypothetical protein
MEVLATRWAGRASGEIGDVVRMRDAASMPHRRHRLTAEEGAFQCSEAQKVSSGSANVQYIDKEGLIPSAYDQTAALSLGPLISPWSIARRRTPASGHRIAESCVENQLTEYSRRSYV